MKKVRV